MNFCSPARKKKRRSTFVDRFRNDTTVLDGPSVKCSSEEIKGYLVKLSNEKNGWMELKQTLHENYLKLKRLNSSGERIPKTTNFLDNLPKEDREFMEILNKRKDEYAYLCRDALSKMNENFSLLTYEFENQVEMIKQISNNYELCLDKLQELICYDDELDDVEIFASQLTSVNEKTTMFDEPVLFIEGI